MQIVDESSAAPILDDTERCGIGADHSNMCKFDGPKAPGYPAVVAALLRYTRNAPAVVNVRWFQARESLSIQRVSEAAELTRSM